MPRDVIAALASPAGESAIAVVRAGGEGCLALVERIFSLEEGRLVGMRRALAQCPGTTPGTEALLISWPSGRSFTGEEMVEILCPGSMRVARGVLVSLQKAGARLARPGEFTRRAFLNGRLSALQVVALASIWSGDGTEDAAEGSTGLEQAAGSLERAMEILHETLEAVMEFPDELAGEAPAIEKVVRTALEESDRFSETASRSECPLRVFIAGPVNAGKSTLFNILAGREMAVVSPEEGTTRDGASCRTIIGGRAVELFDTPGRRRNGEEAPSKVEREAVRISSGLMGPDDLLLWMSPGGRVEPDRDLSERAGWTIEVSSFSDVVRGDGLNLSARTGEGLEALRGAVASARPDGLVCSAALRIRDGIARAAESIDAGEFPQASEEIAEALAVLSSVMDRGASIGLAVERALARMCVGK